MYPTDAHIPIAIVQWKNRLLVRWCDARDRPFTEPMFGHTVDVLLSERKTTQLLTGVDALEAVPRGLPPSGFIFHMSRCGSTLVSQMLAAVECHTVVSEPTPISAILWEFDNLSREDRIRLLKSVVNALGKRPRGVEERYFVKFHSHHVLDLPLFREAFPDVPWVFVYRDPIEVLHSLAGRPSGWFRHRMRFRRHQSVLRTIADPDDLSLVQHGAATLHDYCSSALDLARREGLLLDYSQLPEAVFTHLLPFFEVRLSDAEEACMRKRANFYSKDLRARRVFVPDSTRKKREATDEIRRADERFTRSVYNALERCRERGPAPTKTPEVS